MLLKLAATTNYLGTVGFVKPWYVGSKNGILILGVIRILYWYG